MAAVSRTGVLTAKKAGKATVNVTTANKKKATLTVKVTDPTLPKKVKLNKSGTVKLKVGKALKLKAILSPATAVSKLTWKSSNKKIASVNASGKVRAVKPGTVTVSVKTRNGKTAKVRIKVVK